MGLYDSVWARCPECGQSLEFQSKAGDCILRDYTPDAMPAEIAADLNGEQRECPQCGHLVTIGSKAERWVSLPVR